MKSISHTPEKAFLWRDVDHFQKTTGDLGWTINKVCDSARMRNRLRPKRTADETQAMVDDGTNIPEVDEDQINEENEEQEEHDASPKLSLTRSTTREEITQTDDELLPIVENVKRPWLQYRRIIFILGIIMGVAVAWVFRSPDLQLENLLDSVDMADFFDDLKAVLPSALPIGLVKEAKEIQQHTRKIVDTGAFSIGERLYMEGKTANYPVVMVQFPIPTSLPRALTSSGPWSNFHRLGKLVDNKLLVNA